MNPAINHLAIYGTLMRGQKSLIADQLPDKILYQGKCLIPGQIYNLGRYPGLKLDHSSQNISGELYEIVDPKVLKLLDDYEAHDNDDPTLPGFTRRQVKLTSPVRLAWVYEYDGAVEPSQLITTHTWARA